jgi:hypothetical protein
MENGKSRVFFRSDEMKLSTLSAVESQKSRCGLRLHEETVPMWIVHLHLEFFCSVQVPRNGTLKSRYFRFSDKRTYQKTGVSKRVSFQCYSDWSFGRLAIPWSHGVVACVVIYCRDPKTQRRFRWLALSGCPFWGGVDHRSEQHPKPTR